MFLLPSRTLFGPSWTSFKENRNMNKLKEEYLLVKEGRVEVKIWTQLLAS